MIKRDKEEQVKKLASREFLQYSSDEQPTLEPSTGENSLVQTEKDLDPSATYKEE